MAQATDRGVLEGGTGRPREPLVDVLIVGGGNAALCAALAARSRGANVLVLERATREWRGGNSKYTRNLRCAHDGHPVMSGSYSSEDFLDDLGHVLGPGSDPELTRTMISHSRDLPGWIESHGVRWQPAYKGTLQLSRTNWFFLGGGKALLNAYYASAERAGVQFRYQSQVSELVVSAGRCTGAIVKQGESEVTIPARAVVVACGGFEANSSWLREVWGAAADSYVIRGSRHNDGNILKQLLDLGATPCGSARAMHAVAVDARSPKYEGGIVTRIDSVPFGIVVNREGKRFYDEGEDVWPKRYATWGRLIAEQDGQIAYSIFDSQTLKHFLPGIYPPLEAPSIQELADRLHLPPGALEETVRTYNSRTPRAGRLDPSRLDQLRTRELSPPKSNWAQRLDSPPYFAYPLRPGITFTYLGVRIGPDTRVLNGTGSFKGLYAAGEIMAGNILERGYVAGTGMTIGTVFGRMAGEEAARAALH